MVLFSVVFVTLSVRVIVCLSVGVFVCLDVCQHDNDIISRYNYEMSVISGQITSTTLECKKRLWCSSIFWLFENISSIF